METLYCRTNVKNNKGIAEISTKPLRGFKPIYLRNRLRENADQRTRRKNHKILDSLLKEKESVGKNVEIALENDYRAGFGFEDEFYPGEYRPIWAPHNDCQESRYIKGKIKMLDFRGWGISTLLYLEYEKGKCLHLTSEHIKEIRLLN